MCPEANKSEKVSSDGQQMFVTGRPEWSYVAFQKGWGHGERLWSAGKVPCTVRSNAA